MPRAAAQVRNAGFDAAIPDMTGVGDFDPDSSQPWIRGPQTWYKRERLVIGAFAIMGRI